MVHSCATHYIMKLCSVGHAMFQRFLIMAKNPLKFYTHFKLHFRTLQGNS